MRLIGCIFIVLKGAFLISSIVIMNNFISLVNYVDKEKCTDEITLQIFLFLKDVLKRALSKNIIGVIAVGIIAVFEILATLILCTLSCKMKKDTHQKFNFVDDASSKKDK